MPISAFPVTAMSSIISKNAFLIMHSRMSKNILCVYFVMLKSVINNNEYILKIHDKQKLVMIVTGVDVKIGAPRH